MSELKRGKSQSTEEEELVNLLKVRETIDDLLDKVDNVVHSTENYLFYVSDHRINDTYSKILDELMEEPNSTNSSKHDQKKDNLDNRQHTRMVEGADKSVGKGEDLLHSEDTSKETFSLLSLEKEVNFESSTVTVKQTKSASPQETKVCCENQQYSSKIEEFSLDKVKSDGVGIKRSMLSSPKADHHTCDKILSKSLRNLCKKRKVDISDDCLNEVTIQQKQSINMDIKLARRNFRGPIGIPTDSIAIILDTEKPCTSYKHPIRKPEYIFSRMPSAKLNKAGKNISLIIHSTKEYRKVTAHPYAEDYIELTDTSLTQELDKEYKKIMQGECTNIVDEEYNFLNSPNRTIKLIEPSSGSSTDSREAELAKTFLGNRKPDEMEQYNHFGEDIQTQNYEKALPQKQQSLWRNVDHPPPFQTEPEIQDSMLFSDIVPLQIQTNVEMLNIGKDANCEEEHLTRFLNNIQDSSDSSSVPIPRDFFNVSSTQSSTSSDAFAEIDKEIKTNENVSDKLPVYSPSKLTPSTSSVSRIGASLTNYLESDMYGDDQNDMSQILETDDLNGGNLMTVSKNNTLLNNEPANTVHVSEKIEENDSSVVLPVQTIELDNNFGIIPVRITSRKMNVLNIDPNFYSCSEGCVGNNFEQTDEVDSSSFSSNNINNAGIFTTTAYNDFDSESSGPTTDSTICENFVSIPTEPRTKSILKNSKDVKANNQDNITFNDSIVSFNAENASCSQNIKHSAVITSEYFVEEADATIKNVEENVAKSSDNQSFSDVSTTRLINTPEFNNDDIVCLSDSDTETNVCTTDNLKDRSVTESADTENKVTVSLTDPENNFSSSTNIVPQESYKIEHVAKFTPNHNEDIICLSDSGDEVFPTVNTLPNNVKEKNISACPISKHDVVSLSDSDDLLSNHNTKPYTTNALKMTNVVQPFFNNPEDVIDLADSSSDSVVSINSDEAFCCFKEESTTKSCLDQDDIAICDNSNTSATVSISSNHNMLPLIDDSTNCRNHGEGISDQNQNVPHKTAETNKGKNSDEENFSKPTSHILDFSNDINFENFVFQNDQIEDNTSSAGNSIGDTIASKCINISENLPETSALPQNFYREITGDGDKGISNTYVNEETEKSENSQKKIFDLNKNIGAISDSTCASTSTSYFVPNSSINFNNNLYIFNSNNFDFGKILLTSTGETSENINECNVSIPKVDVQEDESISTSNNCIQCSGNDNKGSEDFNINENIACSENFKHTQSFLLDYNESVKTATVSDAESSSNSLSYESDLKEVGDLCGSNDPNCHNEGTSIDSLTNVDTLARYDTTDVAASDAGAVANIFSSKNIVTPEPFEHQLKSPSIDNYVNHIVSPKTSTIERIGIIDCLFPYNEHSSHQNSIFPNSSSAVSDLEISLNSQHQNNISKVNCLSTLGIKPETSPLTTQKTESAITNIKTILELPYINSEIGMRPSLVNETSHNVPNLNSGNVSQTYVPTININAPYVPLCDSNIDVNQNCTITSSECSNDYKTPGKFTKNNCDNSGKELTLNAKLQTHSLFDVASNSSTHTSSVTSHNSLKQVNETYDKSTRASSKYMAPKHSTHTTNKTTTGVKRPPSTNNHDSNKRYKSSSSNNLLPQTQPTASQTDLHQSDHLDANEIADNNDPKWKLYNFSEPRDFFLAVHNQWCMPMPNPHTDFTRRFYNSRPVNSSNYLIPGNQRDFNVECLTAYEEQLRQINTESTNLKHALDRYGAFWNRRRINHTLNQLQKLDNMHDMLREAWDDAYHFYKFFKDSKTNHNAWYISQFNKNEIVRSLDMLRAYQDYYGCMD